MYFTCVITDFKLSWGEVRRAISELKIEFDLFFFGLVNDFEQISETFSFRK